MGISYNKLWKLLIDKRMKKGDLQRAARISSSSMAKLAKGETVTTEVLVKICTALSCEPGDIMQLETTSNAQGEMIWNS
jgi:DNA-binding Xre family transcriptional regulator